MPDLDQFLAAIDAANAGDPNSFDDEPLALSQGRMADGWVVRLNPDAADALRIAARAHHLRRWAVPRSTYPEGRDGYLRWRRDQKTRHGNELAELLRTEGAGDDLIDRATRIVQKRGLGTDPEVQTFEDAVSLTFIETQFTETADKIADDEKTSDVIAKILGKMSPAGHDAVATITLDDRATDIVRRAAEIASS